MPADHAHLPATLKETSRAARHPEGATWHTANGHQSATHGDHLQQIDADLLRPGRYQPRKDFAPDSLSELADSSRPEGMLQPLIVRPLWATCRSAMR